jgi:hypothetical protein
MQSDTPAGARNSSRKRTVSFQINDYHADIGWRLERGAVFEL